VALGATAAVGVTYYLWKMMSKSEDKEEKAAVVVAAEEAKPKKTKTPKKAEATPEAASTPSPAAGAAAPAATTSSSPQPLSRDNLIAMFSEMVDEMSTTMYRLTMQVSEMQQRGDTEEKINDHFQKEYAESIDRAHNRLLLKYNTTEALADEAAQKYSDDPDFVKLLAQIEKLQRTISGQGPAPEDLATVPDWLDMDKVIEIFTAVMNTVTESIISSMRTVHNAHAESPVSEGQLDKEIQALYKKTIEEKKKQVFQQFEIDETMLDLALSKYAQRPQLSQSIIQMQLRQKAAVEAARKEIRSQSL